MEILEIEELKREIDEKEKELDKLRNRLRMLQGSRNSLQSQDDKLTNDEISRYSRQLILPEIGVSGQLKLKNTSVLIVGAGGLGCPAAQYLAAAGVGKLGIVDYDSVEVSNLHRQVLHQENGIGVSKAESIASSLSRLNSKVKYIPYTTQLSSNNALGIIKQFDIVLDASDNVATRYLLNDACVLAKRPLVSGSALRFEGQLTVYNYKDGPCYRCLFPEPPPPGAVTNCSDGGVIGVVPGIIGCLQALEAIKIATQMTVSYAQKLLLYDGQSGSFKTVKLRPRNPKCNVCSECPSIKELIDYEQFCGVPATDKDRTVNVLSKQDRLTCKQYKEMVDSGQFHILVDVRPKIELDICKLQNTINVPIDVLEKEDYKTIGNVLNQTAENFNDRKFSAVIVCRRGNDSQLAVQRLRSKFANLPIDFKDIIDGLHGWAKEIEPEFPVY